MLKRWIQPSIEKWKSQNFLRGFIITGARQVGKTTLARHEASPDMEYVNLDDPLLHSEFKVTGGEEFADVYPRAILDEVQKVPELFDLVKFSLDTRPHNQYMLLGSAQILLLKNIRESLAGRVTIKELYPLAFCERFAEAPNPWIAEMMNRFSKGSQPIFPSKKEVRKVFGEGGAKWKRHLAWGGMPAQVDIRHDEDWREWVKNYVKTYLQRDLRDLARINDLGPFTKCEQFVALRTGTILNFSELARDTGVSVQTAKNYCSYLEISFQTILVPPFFANTGKRLMKSPKVHMLDIGIQRVLGQQWEALTGQQYESIICSELKKIVSVLQPDWELYHLKTFDGLEIDFFLVKGNRAVAIEAKASSKAHPHDGRHLKNLESITGISNILKFVIYEGREILALQNGIYAIPGIIFFGPKC